MLIRLRSVSAAMLLPLLVTTHAQASCEVSKELYLGVKQQCDSAGRYCGDVPLYKQDVIKKCGPNALADSEGGGAPKPVDGGGGDPEPDGQTSFKRDVPAPDGPLPRSCAYLTKPSYEDVRLNYHMPGAMLCHAGAAYECQSTNGVKDWVYRAPCDVFQGIRQACAVEGTC